MPLKLENREDRLSLQNHFVFYIINPCQICYGFLKTTLFWALHFSAFTKTTDTFNKHKRYHMTLEGLSAKSEPASSKNNEIIEIIVLQKFTSYALCPQNLTVCPCMTNKLSSAKVCGLVAFLKFFVNCSWTTESTQLTGWIEIYVISYEISH